MLNIIEEDPVFTIHDMMMWDGMYNLAYPVMYRVLNNFYLAETVKDLTEEDEEVLERLRPEQRALFDKVINTMKETLNRKN